MNARRWLLAIVGLALIGCGGGPDAASPRSAPPEPLRVAAASDLQGVMPKIVERFRAARGVEVVATFGASGQLAQQVRQGAPFDLFLSANRKFVDDLAAAGAIDGKTVQTYAFGSLSLVVRDDVPAKVRGLADLGDPSIKKFAIANPETAPYGAAARQALVKLGLWDALEPKRVQSETVRQALQFVQTGNAEAAIVGSALARADGVRAVPIDPGLHEPIEQALGLIAESKRRDDAMAFVRFLVGDGGEGKSLLRDAGFRVDFRK